MWGFRLPEQKLHLVLDEVVARARSDEPAPQLWTDRIERLGALGVKMYIATLGRALLARATNPEWTR